MRTRCMGVVQQFYDIAASFCHSHKEDCSYLIHSFLCCGKPMHPPLRALRLQTSYR